ncbi:MAG: hypothetical protein VX519_01615 [Myxococcota bacterium]|nr:hypothetical protein [Myxococcota bacterium]
MSTLDPELWFHERAALYVEVQLLYHLNDLGVFGVLASGERCSTQDLANQLGLVEPLLQTVLDYVYGVDELLDCDAEGRWGLTDFGLGVLERFGRQTSAGPQYNLFDVRVGAYGPVWAAAGELLKGELRYGEGVRRLGERAADGVYKVGARMAPSLSRALSGLGVDVAVEWGVSTGLLQALTELGTRVGVDRDAKAISEAQKRAGEVSGGEISWVQADVFETDTWVSEIPGSERVAFFSVHFHELLSAGEESVVELLRSLSASHAGSYVVAMEQPRLSREAREVIPRAQWLYSQANELIHHLIGNGRILGDEEWRSLFERGGCRCLRVESMEFLGYQLYVFELGAS